MAVAGGVLCVASPFIGSADTVGPINSREKTTDDRPQDFARSRGKKHNEQTDEEPHADEEIFPASKIDSDSYRPEKQAKEERGYSIQVLRQYFEFPDSLGGVFAKLRFVSDV